jgi:HD superfamily phosphohydrolase
MISSLEVYAFNLKKILKNTYIYITYIYLYLHVYQNIIIKIYNYVLNNILNYIMLDKKALILNSYF